MDNDAAHSARESGDGIHEEFEADSFCPANVLFSIECFPAREQVPGPPALSNNDGNPNQ